MRSIPLRLWAEEEGSLALTSAADDALLGGLVLGLKDKTVPALVPEVALALVDGHLDGGDRDVRVVHIHLQLLSHNITQIWSSRSSIVPEWKQGSCLQLQVSACAVTVLL